MNRKIARAERADGIKSRQLILNAAASLATVEGLDGLSIGRLAAHIAMSKSGLYAHFGSKEELQLATIENAYQIFHDVIIAPTRSVEDPVERVLALCSNFLDYLERRVFPGGCFFAAVAAEFDTHPGPVRTRIAEIHDGWTAMVTELIARAQAFGLIVEAEDPQQLAFETNAYLLMANMDFVLHNDDHAVERARRALQHRLDRARATTRQSSAVTPP